MSVEKCQPRTSLCEVNNERIKNLENSIYDNAKGLKSRVNSLEVVLDNLNRQNKERYEELKQNLEINRKYMIGFFISVILLLIAALVRGF